MFAAIVRTLVGAVFGALCAIALVPALAAFRDDGSAGAVLAVPAIVLAGAALGAFAPTFRRALGRGFLLLGFCFLALPVSTLLLSGRVAAGMVGGAAQADQVATAVGAGLGMALPTGAGAFLGVIFGVIFTILGLVLALGGRREGVVVQR